MIPFSRGTVFRRSSAPERGPERVHGWPGSCFTALLPVLAVALGPAIPPAGDAWARTVRVPGDAPNIQAGIDAVTDGDTVLVLPGIYTGTGNRNIEFRGHEIVVRSSGGAAFTVVDCQGQGGGFAFRNHEYPQAVLEGFTVRNAGSEAGIYCTHYSAPTIVGCVVEHCTYWGGISLGSAYASPTIRGCVLRNNYPWGLLLHDTAATVSDCAITGNGWGSMGGGICLDSAGNVRIERCVVTGNGAEYGGGVEVYHSQVVISESTISGNRVQYHGGGICVNEGADVLLDRVILRGNCAGWWGDEGYVGPTDNMSQVRVQCCATDSSEMIAVGGFLLYEGPQVFADPRFCDPEPCGSVPTNAGDYRLDASSPCLPDVSPCGLLIGALGLGCGVDAVPRLEAAPVQLAVRPSAGPGPFRVSFGSIAGTKERPVRLLVADAGGRVRWEREVDSNGGSIWWNGSGKDGRPVPAGVYWLRLTGSANGLAASRLVVVR